MRLVQDQIFLEQLDFEISLEQGFRCIHTTKSMASGARAACEIVGLELIDYESCVFTPQQGGIQNHGIGEVIPIKLPYMTVRLRSKAWRERAERFTRGTKTV